MIDRKTGWVKRSLSVSVMSWTLRTCPRSKIDDYSFFTVKLLPWRSEEFSGIIGEFKRTWSFSET